MPATKEAFAPEGASDDLSAEAQGAKAEAIHFSSRFVFYGSGAIFLPLFRSGKREPTSAGDVAMAKRRGQGRRSIAAQNCNTPPQSAVDEVQWP
jgi:hypothetical protein